MANTFPSLLKVRFSLLGTESYRTFSQDACRYQPNSSIPFENADLLGESPTGLLLSAYHSAPALEECAIATLWLNGDLRVAHTCKDGLAFLFSHEVQHRLIRVT